MIANTAHICLLLVAVSWRTEVLRLTSSTTVDQYVQATRPPQEERHNRGGYVLEPHHSSIAEMR